MKYLPTRPQGFLIFDKEETLGKGFRVGIVDKILIVILR